MRIITISREFGSGGRELGKRLADILGYDYYDGEIISAVAAKSGLDADYVSKTLSEHGWQKIPVTYRGSIGSSAYIQASKVNLLIEQKRVIEQIALLNKNCIIVGRNADVILSEYKPFNIFVCAHLESRVKRCMERAKKDEHITEKELVKKIKQIDKMRMQTRAIISGSSWGERNSYHLTVNTSGWDIKDLAPAVADFADRFFGRLS